MNRIHLLLLFILDLVGGCVFCANSAFAELSREYGMLVGTLDDTRSPYGNVAGRPSHGLEPFVSQGRYLHYIFYVKVGDDSWECDRRQ